MRPEFGREDFLEFRAYCRMLNLKFATFAVLTPLPGTDLYIVVISFHSCKRLRTAYQDC